MIFKKAEGEIPQTNTDSKKTYTSTDTKDTKGDQQPSKDQFALEFQQKIKEYNDELLQDQKSLEFSEQKFQTAKATLDSIKSNSLLSKINLAALTSGNLENLASNVSFELLFDPDEILEYYNEAIKDSKESIQNRLDLINEMSRVIKEVSQLTYRSGAQTNLRTYQTIPQENLCGSEESDKQSDKQSVSKLFSGKISSKTGGVCEYEIANAKKMLENNKLNLKKNLLDQTLPLSMDQRQLNISANYMKLIKTSLDYSSVQADLTEGETGFEYTGVYDPSLINQSVSLLRQASQLCLDISKQITPVMVEGQQKGKQSAELIREALVTGSKKFANQAAMWYKKALQPIFGGQSLPGGTK